MTATTEMKTIYLLVSSGKVNVNLSLCF